MPTFSVCQFFFVFSYILVVGLCLVVRELYLLIKNLFNPLKNSVRFSSSSMKDTSIAVDILVLLLGRAGRPCCFGWRYCCRCWCHCFSFPSSASSSSQVREGWRGGAARPAGVVVVVPPTCTYQQRDGKRGDAT